MLQLLFGSLSSFSQAHTDPCCHTSVAILWMPRLLILNVTSRPQACRRRSGHYVSLSHQYFSQISPHFFSLALHQYPCSHKHLHIPKNSLFFKSLRIILLMLLSVCYNNIMENIQVPRACIQLTLYIHCLGR